MFRLRHASLIAVASLVPLFSGCVYAGAGYEAPAPAAKPVVYGLPPLSPTEIGYARDTARVLFRRRASERTREFVESGPEGYRLCLRSGRDYALLVFPRRIFEDAISQAADDVAILRSSADTAICRRANRVWEAV